MIIGIIGTLIILILLAHAIIQVIKDKRESKREAEEKGK